MAADVATISSVWNECRTCGTRFRVSSREIEALRASAREKLPTFLPQHCVRGRDLRKVLFVTAISDGQRAVAIDDVRHRLATPEELQASGEIRRLRALRERLSRSTKYDAEFKHLLESAVRALLPSAPVVTLFRLNLRQREEVLRIWDETFGANV